MLIISCILTIILDAFTFIYGLWVYESIYYLGIGNDVDPVM